MIVVYLHYPYAGALCLKYESSLIHFDQALMRQQYDEYIDGDLKEYKVPIISNNLTTHFCEMISYSVQIHLINIIYLKN